MRVKIQITLLFTIVVNSVLLLVCGSVYYFSYLSRVSDIKTRLTNTAITTGRLLSESSIFDSNLIQKIDSATSSALMDKVIEVYDSLSSRVYRYSDHSYDTLHIDRKSIARVLTGETLYFKTGKKDAIARYYNDAGQSRIIVAAAYDEDGLAKLRSLRSILLASFLGGLLVSIAGGYVFSLKLLRPLRKISDEVKEISAKNLTRRIRSGIGNEKDEWHYLSDTLNQLLNRLQESFEIQAQFISNASHELSTPLTSVSSQLEVALQRPRTTDEYREVIQSVYQDVRQLNKLTQTLLEFARASGAAGGLQIDQVRIDEILLSLPGEMAKLNPRYSVTLDFLHLPEQPDELLVFGNEELLSTALKNIAVNGCKYSDDHHVAIQFSLQDKEILITVTNVGKGIEEKDFENIFQPFYRANEDPSILGFGLGLSLATRIIKLHKGTVSVHSIFGRETTFTIMLPSARFLN